MVKLRQYRWKRGGDHNPIGSYSHLFKLATYLEPVSLDDSSFSYLPSINFSQQAICFLSSSQIIRATIFGNILEEERWSWKQRVDLILIPGDWGDLGFLHLHLHSLFLLEDPPWHESSHDKVTKKRGLKVPTVFPTRNITVSSRGGNVTHWTLDKHSTNAHDAFFYIECICNAWFTIEIFVRCLYLFSTSSHQQSSTD